MLQRLENDYDAHVSELGAYLGYLLVKRTNFNELDAAAREKTREFGEFIDRTREEQDRIRDELAAALRSVRAAAADAGVGQQSIAFEKQVKVYTASARGWLRAAIWSGGLSAIAVGGLLFAWAPSAETTGEIVREIGGRSPL